LHYGTYASKLDQTIFLPDQPTSITIDVRGLQADTAYFYTLELVNPGGMTTTYDNQGFPFVVQTGKRVTAVNYTFETALGWTTHSDSLTTETWQIITPKDQTIPHSPTHCWFCPSGPHLNESLVMPPVDIIPGATLSFWHVYDLQAGFDGGVIEISVDNGAHWQDLGSQILQGGYNSTINEHFVSPIAGRPAWSGGQIGPMSQVLVDLSNYVGVGRLIRFRQACGQNKSGTGWYIDDVDIDNLATFEPDTGWSHSDSLTTDTWKVIAPSNLSIPHSPTHCWFCPSVARLKDDSLVMPPVDIAQGTTLSFWHVFDLEYGLDGGVIEISVDQGATWQDLGSQILQGGYNTMISGNFGSPIAGRAAWSGGQIGYMSQVLVDLSNYVGSGRLIRFRMACDQTNTRIGWYIDDVGIEDVVSTPPHYPASPTLLSPANNAIHVPVDGTALLTWQAADNAGWYLVYFGDSTGNLQVLGVTTTTFYPIQGDKFKAGSSYFWRVVAANALAQAPSPIWSFVATTLDPLAMAEQLIGKPSGLNDSEVRAGDINGDGKIDLQDLMTDVNRKNLGY